LEVKLKVLDQFDRGEHSIGLSYSAVRTIYDSADTIHQSTQSTMKLRITRLIKSWCDTTEIMERMLATRIKHQKQQNMPQSGAVIEEKVFVKEFLQRSDKRWKGTDALCCRLWVVQLP
jgi:hypothetical protein